jgi:hypothetical protein
MMAHTVTREALQGQSLEVLLHQVVTEGVTVTVLLPDGHAVLMEPKPALQFLSEREARAEDGVRCTTRTQPAIRSTIGE